MSSDFDALILKKEAEIALLNSRMEELRIIFTEQVAGFASGWYQATAKFYVAKYPEITLGLTEEKMVAMKTKVNTLITNAERTAKAQLSNPQYWWHLNPGLHDSFDQYTQAADKYPEILDQAVRRVLGPLGVVLEEYGFNVAASGSKGLYEEFWFEPSGSGGLPVPYYPHILKWSEVMQDTIRKYNANYTRAITLFNEIQKLKDEKKKQQAMARWNSILSS